MKYKRVLIISHRTQSVEALAINYKRVLIIRESIIRESTVHARSEGILIYDAYLHVDSGRKT
jgi:hypothetical protein